MATGTSRPASRLTTPAKNANTSLWVGCSHYVKYAALEAGHPHQPLRSIARIAAQFMGPGPARVRMIRLAQGLEHIPQQKKGRAA